MQDYRDEVNQFFSGDEQLAAEVEFALKMADEEREMLEQMETCNLTRNAQIQQANVRMWNISITHQYWDINYFFLNKTAIIDLYCCFSSGFSSGLPC